MAAAAASVAPGFVRQPKSSTSTSTPTLLRAITAPLSQRVKATKSPAFDDQSLFPVSLATYACICIWSRRAQHRIMHATGGLACPARAIRCRQDFASATPCRPRNTRNWAHSDRWQKLVRVQTGPTRRQPACKGRRKSSHPPPPAITHKTIAGLCRIAH